MTASASTVDQDSLYGYTPTFAGGIAFMTFFGLSTRKVPRLVYLERSDPHFPSNASRTGAVLPNVVDIPNHHPRE